MFGCFLAVDPVDGGSNQYNGPVWGYTIQTKGSNPQIFEYGITARTPQDARPQSQLRTCKTVMGKECTFKLHGPFKGRPAACNRENARIMHHKRIYGCCPPGQEKSGR